MAPLVAKVLATLLVPRAKALGAVVSTTTDKAAEAVPTFPAASVALAVRVWLPLLSVDEVMLQLPPVAVPVPSTVVPSLSYKVTALPDSAVPVKMGAVTLVMLSVVELPESDALAKSGVLGDAGTVWSSV